MRELSSQALAFTDGLARAVGATGGIHPRSSMSLANVVYNASFGWSDRTWSLEAQMEVPMYNEHPVEMGLKGHEAEVLERFAADADYSERFRAAFPAITHPVSLLNIVKAIASFERVLVSADSAFDRYLYKDDDSGMSPAAKRGVALFFSDRLKCSECHGSVNISGPTIFAGAMPSDPEAFFHDTGVAAEPAKFRAPTLRNIAVTAPYMHDGSIATLKDVVAHYAAAGGTTRPKSDKVRGFAISPAETDDLVAFLHTLTDETFLTNPAFSNPLSNPDLRRESQRGQRTNSEPARMAHGVSLVILTAGCPWLRSSARVKSAELSHARSRRAPASTRVRLIDANESVAARQSAGSDAGGAGFRVRHACRRRSRSGSRGWRVGDRARRSRSEQRSGPARRRWQLLRRLKTGGYLEHSVLICAGAAQHALMQQGFDELGLSRRRVIGSAPESLAVNSPRARGHRSGRSVQSGSADGRWAAPRQVRHSLERSVCRRTQRRAAADAPPQLHHIERRLRGLWPPGPAALGTAAALFCESVATGSRRVFSAFVSLDRDNGTKAPVCAWPVSIGASGLERVTTPALSGT